LADTPISHYLKEMPMCFLKIFILFVPTFPGVHANLAKWAELRAQFVASGQL
jgi:hypothetical protein